MRKIYGLLGVCLLSACQTLPTSSEYLLRGDGYFKDGNAPKALQAYNRAIELNPENLEAYSSRGTVHFFSGNYDLAEADFIKVLQANPYHVDTYTAYATTLAVKGDFQHALQVLNTAERLQPAKPEILFSRAGVYFMLGRYKEALRDYTAVLSVRPAADVYYARANVYLKMGEKDLATRDFNTAKTVSMPKNLEVYAVLD